MEAPSMSKSMLQQNHERGYVISRSITRYIQKPPVSKGGVCLREKDGKLTIHPDTTMQLNNFHFFYLLHTVCELRKS